MTPVNVKVNVASFYVLLNIIQVFLVQTLTIQATLHLGMFNIHFIFIIDYYVIFDFTLHIL